MVMRGLLCVLETNCIRQPKGQLPSLSYNHITLKTLITSFTLRAWKFLTATMKSICSNYFTDVLRVVSGLWLENEMPIGLPYAITLIYQSEPLITTVSSACLQPC